MKQKSLAHNISGDSLVSHPRGIGNSVKQKSLAHNMSGGSLVSHPRGVGNSANRNHLDITCQEVHW